MQSKKVQSAIIAAVIAVVIIVVIMLSGREEQVDTKLMYRLEPDMAYAHLLVGESVELNLEYYFDREGVDITHIYSEEEIQQAISEADIIIQSEDTSVASVNEHVIVAETVGETNVVISSDMLDCEINIFINVVDYATELVVSEVWELDIDDVGQKLPVISQPSHTLGTVLITVADETVALVDKDAFVTPVSAGETLVTFTLVDGDTNVLDVQTTNLIITE